MNRIINWNTADDSEIVCYCNNVTKGEIVKALRENSDCNKLECVMRKTGAGVGKECKTKNPRGRCCHIDIQKIIFFESGEIAPKKECCGSGCCEPK